MHENDREHLIREKYGGNRDADLSEDMARLAAGEPLAYVIGSIPFLGLRIRLDSRPLIPRPETEWWTEELIASLRKDTSRNTTIYNSVSTGEKEKRGGTLRVLDLCAGSGAIGCAVLKEVPGAHVSFGEIDAAHEKTIRENIRDNGLDEGRADIRIGDLFDPFSSIRDRARGHVGAGLSESEQHGNPRAEMSQRADLRRREGAHGAAGEVTRARPSMTPSERYDIIATNPPYIPETRELPESVRAYEPAAALYAGPHGLSLIERIAKEAPAYMAPRGELWMEVDTEHAEEARALVAEHAVRAQLRNDLYGRPRLVVGYYC